MAVIIGAVTLSCLLIVWGIRKGGNITKIIGNTGVRLVIAVLLLFFFNVFAGHFGWHIPINIFSVAVTGIFGIYGMGSLLALQLLFL